MAAGRARQRARSGGVRSGRLRNRGQSGWWLGGPGDDVTYDDAVLSQGCPKPPPLRLAGLVPGVLQPLHGRSASARAEVTGEVLANIRDQAYALVIVARRVAFAITSTQVPAQVGHRADLHERVLDEQQTRVGCGVLATSSASAHLLILYQVAYQW